MSIDFINLFYIFVILVIIPFWGAFGMTWWLWVSFPSLDIRWTFDTAFMILVMIDLVVITDENNERG